MTTNVRVMPVIIVTLVPTVHPRRKTPLTAPPTGTVVSSVAPLLALHVSPVDSSTSSHTTSSSRVCQCPCQQTLSCPFCYLTSSLTPQQSRGGWT